MFSSFGNERQGNTEGIGLGLTICKQITEFFGGEIKFTSKWRAGTKFTFYFLIKDHIPQIETLSLKNENEIESSYRVQEVDSDEIAFDFEEDINSFALKNFAVTKFSPEERDHLKILSVDDIDFNHEALKVIFIQLKIKKYTTSPTTAFKLSNR